MIRDPRGGHNRYKVNEDFFKTWSPNMVYVLGYIYADGCVIDSHRSSRTQYLTIGSKDCSILHKINRALGCKKPLDKRPSRLVKYPGGKMHQNSLTYLLRIGNRIIFNDLIKLGLTPRKSLSLKVPRIPDQYFSHFLRGYFDGDGCLTLSKPPKRKAYCVRLIFASGSKRFLGDIANVISRHVGVKKGSIYQNTRSFNLVYYKKVSLKILRFMYLDTERNKLYLDRKYKHYLHLLKSEKNRP